MDGVVGGDKVGQGRRPYVHIEQFHVIDQVVVTIRCIGVNQYCLFCWSSLQVLA